MTSHTNPSHNSHQPGSTDGAPPPATVIGGPGPINEEPGATIIDGENFDVAAASPDSTMIVPAAAANTPESTAPVTLGFAGDQTKDLHGGTATAAILISNPGSVKEPAATLFGGTDYNIEDDCFDFDEGEEAGPGKQKNTSFVIGDHLVVGELGRGGMGVVYKALHRKLNRLVALKMILAGKHSGDDALKRFIAEAQAVAQLQHPGIVQVFEINEHQGLPYFSLEFVDGKDLHRDLNGQPRDARRSAELVAQLCEAMQYAHDHRILHRDLKPANVMLTKDGKPKITDFGLAKQVDEGASGQTSDGTIMGSPSYMPPEQARGELSSITPRSDLYSLGAILYQMLTGRPPFITDRPLDTVMQVVNNDPVQPRDLQPGIPVDMETICMKALQKDPALRYENCAALGADLRRFLNGEPILARPVSRLERTWRWCKRNPKIAVPSGIAGFFITATALIATWAWKETTILASNLKDERDTVKEQRDVIAVQKAEVEKQKLEVEKQRDEAKRQETIAMQQKLLAEDKERLARKQAQLALESMQFVLTDIDKSLSQQAGSTELRIAILESMSKKWDELNVALTVDGIRGEAIPTFMSIRHLLGNAFISLDRLKEADVEMEKLHRMAEERFTIRGRNDSTRTNLAKIKITWSQLKRRLDGDPDAAKRLLLEAAELIRDVLSNPRPEPGSPTPNEIQELLAAASQNLGVEYLREGKLPETATAFTEALNAQARVLENIRAEPGFVDLDEHQRDGRTANQQIAHDKAALGLAYILVRLGRTEDSIAMYDKAIAGRREIYARRPTMLPLKVELAGHLGNYGNACLWIDQPDKADPLLTESLQLSEEIYAADPEKADYKRALSVALYRMGTLRDVQGRAQEALASFERSRLLRSELVAASPDEKNQINLMLAEARVGNVEAAEALINRLGESTKSNGELHLERARALSQLTRRTDGDKQTQLRDAALTALERAVANGYSDPFRVTAEQDLDPLHEEVRFKAVVADLAAAAKAP